MAKTEHRLVALDVETTGFSPNAHRIVEIGLVEVMISPSQNESSIIEPVERSGSKRDLRRLPLITSTEFQCYFNPQVDFIHPKAVEAHGLTLEFLSDYGDFAAKIDVIDDFIGNCPIIGHNLDFDLRFLAAEYERAGRKFAMPVTEYCTMKTARSKWGVGGNKLEELCQRLAVPYLSDQLHGALYDAKLAAQCWIKLCDGEDIIPPINI